MLKRVMEEKMKAEQEEREAAERFERDRKIAEEL